MMLFNFLILLIDIHPQKNQDKTLTGSDLFTSLHFVVLFASKITENTDLSYYDT